MSHGFANVHTEVPVRYKFVSKTIPLKDDTVHVGRSKDFSSAGIAVVGKCPDDPLLGYLIRGEVFVGLNIVLPNREEPVKVLGRLIWLEVDEEAQGRCRMGLRFVEIDKESKDALVRFSIRSQITRRFGP